MATVGRGEAERARLLRGRLEFAERLVAQLAPPKDGAPPSVANQVLAAYTEILDECLLDVALEVHRAAHTGGAQEAPGKVAGDIDGLMRFTWDPSRTQGPVKVREDVFGQQHATVATETLVCVHCGRKVIAGRFAPHLEKCLGKGRGGVRAASRRR